MNDELDKLKAELKKLRAEFRVKERQLKNIIAEKEAFVKGEKIKFDLDKAKRQFWLSVPQDRTDPFTDWELVYWASYLLATTNRKEILNSVAEVAKRAQRVKPIIQYYGDMVKTIDPVAKDTFGRIKTKEYLKYVLWEIPEFKTKDGPKPMTFYVATSPWAVNNYGPKVFSYSKEQAIIDSMVPFPDDED